MAVLVLLTSQSGGGQGAWFLLYEANALQAAADALDGVILTIDRVTLDEIDASVSQGRFEPDGAVAPLPYLLRSTFDRLLRRALAASHQLEARAWLNVRPGEVVLASDTRGEGWWECDVLARTSFDDLTLRWCGWPDLPPFQRSVHRVGLPPRG